MERFRCKMAEASNNKHSCFLFTREDGSPIKFLIRTCKEKKRLRPLIEVCFVYIYSLLLAYTILLLSFVYWRKPNVTDPVYRTKQYVPWYV